MPKVSIIIPVYGVEKYIERCSRSLFEQTLDDLEYLFIDDCTPDKSIDVLKNILEEYPNRKNQVIIHRMDQNSGQAIVRRWGMLNATGKYVTHCDSDDWIDVRMYEAMYNKAITNNADVVVCDYEITDGNKECKRVNACHANSPRQLVENCLLQIDPWSLCNKMFSRISYYNIEFPQGALGEDMVICIQSLFNCKTLSYIDCPFYKYYFNPTSITKTLNRESCIIRSKQLIDNSEILLRVIDNHKNEGEYDAGKIIFQDFVRSVLYPLIHEKEYYNLWRNLFGGINIKVLFSKHVSLSKKIRVILATIHLYPRKKGRVK